MSAPWDVRYARTSDGTDVAYATFGDGPADVVLIHGFITHLDVGISEGGPIVLTFAGTDPMVAIRRVRGRGRTQRAAGG